MKLFALFSQNKAVDVPKTVDEIEDAVYAHLKPYGFKKYGRTLHRFVSEDISQVIHFQSGMPTKGMGGLLCVNIGIRIPECADRAFQPQDKVKKYYHEYECTMRSRLGIVGGQKETWYKLSDRTDGIIKNITEEIDKYVLPAFDALDSREAILAYRREYPLLDNLSSLILLDECMIYGRLGDVEKAKELFELYYQSVVENRWHKDYLDELALKLW